MVKTHREPVERTAPHLALILPHAYTGGTARLFDQVVQYFQTSSDFRVTLGLTRGHFAKIRGQLSCLQSPTRKVEVREFEWQRISQADAASTLAQHGVTFSQLVSPEYFYPGTAEAGFDDCDFWLFISDRICLSLLPARPYGIWVTDHLQRYVPNIFDEQAYRDRNSVIFNFIRNVRNANVAVATSQATFEDLNSFSGTLGTRIRVPTMVDIEFFDRMQLNSSAAQLGLTPKQYFVWVTNCSQHKNHLRAVDSLANYFSMSDEPLDVVVTGLNTDLLDPRRETTEIGDRQFFYDYPYIKEVREYVALQLDKWLDRMHFFGEVGDSDYLTLLRDSRFLMHNVIADNGTFSVVEAAMLGIPSISSDYPQMRELNESFELGLSFFDAYDSLSAANAILAGCSGQAPQPERVRTRIASHHFSNWGTQLRDTIEQQVHSPTRHRECL